MKPTIRHISGFSQHYDWGDQRAIHELRGTHPDGEPLAEVWFGTHRDGPSKLDDGTLLEDMVAPRQPGAAVDGLPYLVKLIAPAMPLSIQVHPSIPQAEAGFDLENKLGIEMSSPKRSYKDRNHKPEMLLALSPWRALIGFADKDALIHFNEELNIPLSRRIASELRESGLSETIYMTVTEGVKPDRAQIREYVDRCSDFVDHADPFIRERAKMLVHVDRFFPSRPSLLVAAAMNIVDLQPGEALFVPVGTIHAYLSGTGLEVMASSANTIRAGLTSKHIDVEGLLHTARMESTEPQLIEPTVGTIGGCKVRTYQPNVDDFHLEVVEPGNASLRGRASADTIIVSIEGDGTVSGESLACGHAVWVPAGVQIELSGDARFAVVSVRAHCVDWAA
ncbi:MAG: mannose-6-phosphate isomerase, class I [Gleimia sp.]